MGLFFGFVGVEWLGEGLVFLVDKLVAGGLDDWEVKIADFVGFVGERCEKSTWVP